MSLLNFLKENEASARKVFGKKELKIIVKQLNGYDLTQSEKNRLSRDIRQKLDFIRKCARFEDEFKLKKNQINRDIIRESVKILLDSPSAPDYELILLGGSFADKTFVKRSDIDIFVLFKKPITIKEATLFRKKMLGKLHSKVDLQILNILPEKIKRSVMKNHKMLFNKGF